MSRLFAGSFLALLLLAPVWRATSLDAGRGAHNASPNPTGARPTGQKEPEIVNLIFNATDSHGLQVTNVTVNEIQILEDGVPQKIKFFSSKTDVPLTLGLLMDTSGSMQRALSAGKVAAADFLRQAVTERDLGFVISFDVSADLLQDLTSDIHLLRSGLDKARINIRGEPGPIPISNPTGTLLYDAVYLAANEILAKQVGRKFMVVLTDGVDEGSKMRLKDAIEAALRAGAVCYVILISDPQYESDPRGMADLATSTGGRRIDATSEPRIGDAFSQISAELRSEYVIGYAPDPPRRDGAFHKIEIKATRPGIKVRAPSGYYAPSN